MSGLKSGLMERGLKRAGVTGPKVQLFAMPIGILMGVGLFAGLLAALACLAGGPLNRNLHGDSPYYSDLAYSLSSGQGYVLHRSPWPTSPHVGRLPLWPALMTPGARLLPQDDEGSVVRGTGMLVHALAAILMALLTFRIWSNRAAAALSGVLFGAFPPELARVSMGDSEPAFFLFAAAGLLLVLTSRRGWVQGCGALLSGLAVLARSNYLILPFTATLAILLIDRGLFRHWQRMTVLAGLFFLPASTWVVRNYLVSGAFPLVSSIEGETLYGSNNVVVATNLDSWGSWIHMDQIPGERPREELARAMNETQLNAYYRHKAVRYALGNWRLYPRLILGKVVRAFAPVPWNPLDAGAGLALACIRGVLYFVFFCWVVRGRVLTKAYAIYLIALVMVTLVTTVLFYGAVRFTLCLDAFLLPCISVAIIQRFKTRLRWSN